MNNFLHCRNNAIFQMPFCIFWPLAGVSWASCLCFRALAQSDSIFTRVNDGSYLVLTTKGVLKYTPEINVAPICCSCSCCTTKWEERVVEFPWDSFDSAPTDFRTHIKDPGCGVGDSGSSGLHSCFGMCLIIPCAECWHSLFKTSVCGFEDSNTYVLYKDQNNTGKLSAFNYGPDLRAPLIRETINRESSSRRGSRI